MCWHGIWPSIMQCLEKQDGRFLVIRKICSHALKHTPYSLCERDRSSLWNLKLGVAPMWQGCEKLPLGNKVT